MWLSPGATGRGLLVLIALSASGCAMPPAIPAAGAQQSEPLHVPYSGETK